MRWEPGKGFLRRDRHLVRLRKSAAYLGITPRDIDKTLTRVTGEQSLRVRLTVDVHGQATVTAVPFHPLPKGTIWRIEAAKDRLCSGDPWLGVKTTQRQLYDTARANLPDGMDEVIFLNERDELCEGTITNLFADLGQGLCTPPLACGVLPGILREEMLDNGTAQEARLTQDDLRRATAIFVGNSLRGLIPARLV